MPQEERRKLTDSEKEQLLQRHTVCYICQLPLDGYSKDEIQFDHIYSYASGYSQDLENFAPVHASNSNGKNNCHKDKGRKKPVDYREELRIKNELKNISSLKDIRYDATPSHYNISDDKKSININGNTLPLYNQRIDGKNNFYFFHEIDTNYIENDDLIQLRPLESKIVPLIFNLKRSVQLLPSLGRLDDSDNKIKIFDGQHKAVAQIIGNKKEKIPCIVFVNADTAKLREVIYEAHTDFVQQRYKKSHMDAKLADIYSQKIADFRKSIGDQNAPYTEHDILKDEKNSKQKQFIISGIIDEIRNELDFIRLYVAQDKIEQKIKPMLWQSLEKMISIFCMDKPVDKPSDDINNFRSSEIENICFIINQIEEHAIRGKWNPDNPEDLNHLLCRTYFYKTAFNNWVKILEKALRFSFEQLKNQAIHTPLCYRASFDTITKNRFRNIIKRCFDAPLWVIENNQKEIAGANKEAIVQEVFDRENFHYIYLTQIGATE